MLAISTLVTNIIAGGAVALIIGGAITYIIIKKKKGCKCIGCPHAHTCKNKNCK